MLTIRPVRPEDETDISILLVHAFGQPDEYRLVQRLRANSDVEIELLAELDGMVAGHVCFSRLASPEGWLTLAPLSVRPADQRKGVGAELVRYGLDLARQRKLKAAVVVGGPEYYSRFGFLFPEKRKTQLQSPYPGQYTGLYPIDPASLAEDVTLVYPPAFEAA